MEALRSRELERTGYAEQYDSETKELVVGLFLERREQTPNESFLASFRRVRELTGIPIDTMRTWVTKAQVDAGERPGTTSADHDEILRLKPENAELRRANEILKTASAFSAAAELDRQRRRSSLTSTCTSYSSGSSQSAGC